MQESATLDELDLSLINTLQLDPRAPWSRVAHALELDPVTVARRWERLASSGTAWVTAQLALPMYGFGAFVDVDCEAGSAFDVANTLSLWPHVVTVEHTSGNRDLLLTVAVPDLTSLSRFLLESVGALRGVRATRTQLIAKTYAVGGDWRLRALAPEQRARLAAETPGGASAPKALTPQDRRIILRLGEDGRTSLTELAAEIGTSVSTARRRLRSLITSDQLVLRCEVAQPLSGWPISTWIWAQVPANERDAIAHKLAAVPETRVCLGITGGPANLFYSAWLPSLDDAQRLEHQLAERVPNLRLLDHSVVLRFVKRMGRILDLDGRSVHTVPMDIWSDPVDSARTSQS